MHKQWVLLVVVGSLLSLGGCATTSSGPAAEYPDTFENYNRKMHRFNSGLYRRVIHPIGKGVDFILPEFVEEGVASIFENLAVPNTALNNLAQGKPKSAGQDALRFGINTTLGIGGIFDWASMWGIPHHEEDLGQTLAKYGVAPGPYTVLPILGGVTPRDFFGTFVSADPTYLLNSDDLVAVEGVSAFVGLAEAADISELPPYEKQRELFYASRHCSILDGSAEATKSCELVCAEFSEMMSQELDASTDDLNDPKRVKMEAKMQNFMPAYCRREPVH